MSRIITILFLLFVFYLNTYATESYLVSNGVIDLTDWNSKEDDIVLLHGKWEFYWNELLEPKDFTSKDLYEPKYVIVPGIWNKDTISAHGYGTYRLLVKVKNNESLNIKISGVSTAYKLWINKKFINEVGKVEKSKEQYKPKLIPKIYVINPDLDYKLGDTRIIEVVLQVSNYYHVNSGIWKNVELGSFEKMTSKAEKSNLLISIILGILLIMALYNFSLFYLRRNKFSALFFGLFLFTMVIRGITTNNRLIFDIFPSISFQLLVRMEYLSAYTNIIFAGLFFYSLFKNDINKTIIKIIVAIGLIVSFIIIVTPMSFFTSLRDVFNVFVFLSGIYITFIGLVKAMINRRQNSIMAFVGMFFLFGTGVFDIIITVTALPYLFTAPYGLVFYVLIQSFILSKKYSFAFSENKALTDKLNYHNKNLEKIVEDRTIEINKQKKIIEQKEERLKTIIKNQGDGFVIINIEKEFVFVNHATEEIFEVEKGELLNKKINMFLDEVQCEKLFGQGFNNYKGKHIVELSLKLKKGKIKHIQITQTPDFDRSGVLIGSIGIIRDTTRLKNAELELIERNRDLNKYFVAIDQSSAAIVFTNIKGDIEYVNPQFEKLTGFSFDEVKDKNPRVLKSGKTPNQVYKSMWKTIARGGTWEGDFINCKKDGTEFIEKAIISPIKNNSGKVISYVAIKEDITKLKKAEQNIKIRNEQRNILINNLPAHIYFKDIDLKYQLVNNSYAKLLNRSVSEVIGKTDDEVFPEEYLETFKNIDFKIIKNKEPILDYENKYTDNSGNSYWYSTSKVPYFDTNGNVSGIIGIVQNITEKKRLNNKLLELLENTEIQKKIIEETHKDIISSINYAKGIQDALLPTPQIMGNLFHDYFLFFKPKEAVSGDFYYTNKIDDTIVFSAADCTGHGVPGAFMTILSITFLNEIIKREKIIFPSDILEQLRFRIKGIFSQFGGINNNGLDIVLCSLDTKTNILQYSGANNPLFVIRDSELIEYKPTRAPIGEYPKLINFENIEIQLQKNDLVYLASDGFQDQFGSCNKKKFTKKRFKKLLIQISSLPMHKQKQVLEDTIVEWMGDNNQIDDMLIMGIEIKS